MIDNEISLDILIAQGDCDVDCPPEDERPDATGIPTCCVKCIGMSHFETNELSKRFTIEEREKIKSLCDSKNGFFGVHGCVLDRWLRPEACIRYFCKE